VGQALRSIVTLVEKVVKVGMERETKVTERRVRV